MNPKDIILAGLSPGDGASYTPVQVQKMFFLIDRNIPELVDGPIFNFQPYNYGPFDKTVYEVLEQLSIEGLVDIVPDYNWNSYKLTVDGQKLGDEVFSHLDAVAQKYITEVSNFVRSLSFTQLISAIYKKYPDMRVNSVFQEQ